MKTQKQYILEHLKEHGSITSQEAFKLYGATRLSGVIWRLKHKDGYDIESIDKVVKTRYGRNVSVSEYVLR